MVSLSCTALSRPVLKIPPIRADRGVSLSKRCRISRREVVQAATGGAVDSRDAKSPLSTCSSLYHLGNLRATVRATVHTVSKAALRSAAAGHAAPFAFNAAAGGEPRGSFALPPAHASARHVAPPDLPALDVALVSLRGPEAFVEVRDPTVAGVRTCFSGVRSSVKLATLADVARGWAHYATCSGAA